MRCKIGYISQLAKRQETHCSGRGVMRPLSPFALSSAILSMRLRPSHWREEIEGARRGGRGARKETGGDIEAGGEERGRGELRKGGDSPRSISVVTALPRIIELLPCHYGHKGHLSERRGAAEESAYKPFRPYRAEGVRDV